MDYSNLKDKMIFDFTDDEELIRQITIIRLSKNEYLERLKLSPISRAFHLARLAHLTNNVELDKAVEIQLGDEIEMFFDE